MTAALREKLNSRNSQMMQRMDAIRDALQRVQSTFTKDNGVLRSKIATSNAFLAHLLTATYHARAVLSVGRSDMMEQITDITRLLLQLQQAHNMTMVGHCFRLHS